MRNGPADVVRIVSPQNVNVREKKYIWESNGGSLGLVWLRRSVVDLLFFYPYFYR
jgi:hypothetical protein